MCSLKIQFSGEHSRAHESGEFYDLTVLENPLQLPCQNPRQLAVSRPHRRVKRGQRSLEKAVAAGTLTRVQVSLQPHLWPASHCPEIVAALKWKSGSAHPYSVLARAPKAVSLSDQWDAGEFKSEDADRTLVGGTGSHGAGKPRDMDGVLSG